MAALLPVVQRPQLRVVAQLPLRRAQVLPQRCFVSKGGVLRGSSAGPLRSAAVDRVTHVDNAASFEAALTGAGSDLVVVEVFSPNHCESGIVEIAQELPDMTKCAVFQSSLNAIAEECPDIKFVSVEVEGHDHPMCDVLGVSILPTAQFYRAGAMVWEHRGYHKFAEELGEGILYYGGVMANNEKASDYVSELKTKADLDTFLSVQPQDVLAVVDVSTYLCEPCMHIYPAVLGLAKSFTGYASFARLIGEEDGVFENLLAELDVQEVPTFLLFRGGKEVGRHTGDTRDLIMKILQVQESFGVLPPAPAGRSRRSMYRTTKPRRSPWAAPRQ